MLEVVTLKEAGQIAVAVEFKSRNGNNLKNVGHETSRTFKNKKREYLEGKT